MEAEKKSRTNRSAATVLEGAISAIVFLLSAGPSLVLLGALLFFPARFLWNRLRR